LEADAKSIKMDRLDDNYIIRLNIRYAINGIILIGSLCGLYYNTAHKIELLERNVAELQDRVNALEAKHQEEIEKVMSWYEELSLNPLTGFKKKRK
tara:strand:- start:18434 stop:18721 length:288 start_codon:yes stop_codon:yes gene_type:complete